MQQWAKMQGAVQAALWVSQIACTRAHERACVHAACLTQSAACEDTWPPVFVLETAEKLRRHCADCASGRSEFKYGSWVTQQSMQH